ncbi:MAG: Gfo/Idh/MocA family oxidoreductase [Phaeodactylibacter sp.]|nr:Gfo/Idh/MocA family oxidoreductase [Phaeodactylibacter sp.]MCB9300543.1 Gfo/Idh/MocA family oxidoreductase [Lewinellaceae bacterium]
MKIHNIGIIGYGGFGKFLHNSWTKLENARVVAVADKAAQQTQGLRSVRTYTHWPDILLEKDIDLVAIATVPDTHEEIATACMEAGKHILIEKPLAISLTEAEKIIQTRNQTQVVAAIDFMMRFNPLLQEIQSLTHGEVFGKLRRVSVENYAQDALLPPDHWFWRPGCSGGILIEHGVHFIDLVHFLNPAKPLSVTGLKHNRTPRQEDQAIANVLYEGGLFATHYHAFSRPGFFEATKIKLAYDLADLELHGWIPLRAELKALVNPSTKQKLLSSALFEMGSAIPIQEAADESRPAGWGPPDSPIPPTERFIRSGGIRYEVDEMVSGQLLTRRSKQDIYSSSVRASLLDVLRKIDDPAHLLTAPLEAGLASLEIAVKATEFARKAPGVLKN